MSLRKFILALLIIGGINWGLVGIFDYNLITGIFGTGLEVISRIIFAVVGIAGLWAITYLFDHERTV